MQLLALVIVAYNPPLVNYLPQRLSLTSDTAPPPVNPKLQYCIEQVNFEHYRREGDRIRAAISQARKLDLSPLPARMRKQVAASFDKAEATFALLADIDKAVARIKAAEPAYRPLHTKVRELQRDIRKLEQEKKEVSQQLRLLAKDDPKTARKRAAHEARLKQIEAEQKALTAQIPANWEEEHKKFAKLLAEEKKARLAYRRNVDAAYEPIGKAVAILAATDALKALEADLRGVRDVIEAGPNEAAAAHIAGLLSKVGSVEGARPIRSALAKVRRALRGRSPDREKALKALEKTLKIYAKEVAWREKAAATLLPGLKAYDMAIRDTIGLRQQPRIPEHLAVEIAECTSHHRDISLHF
ncbi:MAG: hypothetical protein D6773_12365 [Alphaproteobacteria bacterium]|nr:MAG: hypothetical protein D6773_12365 [Alphaproteobacteria bacterium]